MSASPTNGNDPAADVLLIEGSDSDGMWMPLVAALGSSGYRCTRASRGDALKAMLSDRPDLVLLDHDPPDLEAWQLLVRLVEFKVVPLLLFSEISPDDPTVKALQMGADAVMRKPIQEEELVARVDALLRWRAAGRKSEPVLRSDLVIVDRLQQKVHVLGKEIALTPTEFRLLAALAARPGRVVSHSDLVELAWPDSFRETTEVKLYVSYLRRSFGRAEVDPIETVRGIGYRFAPRRISSPRS